MTSLGWSHAVTLGLGMSSSKLKARDHSRIDILPSQIPALYVLALIVVFAVDFSDNYEEPGAEMFSGLGSVSMSYQGACILGIYCAGVMMSVIAWWLTYLLTHLLTYLLTYLLNAQVS